MIVRCPFCQSYETHSALYHIGRTKNRHGVKGFQTVHVYACYCDGCKKEYQCKHYIASDIWQTMRFGVRENDRVASYH